MNLRMARLICRSFDRLGWRLLVSAALVSALCCGNAVAASGEMDAARRLTKTEYVYILQDLLKIPEDAAKEAAQSLPVEAEAGDFDTVATTQGMSGLHVRSYLDAADRALTFALQTGEQPNAEPVFQNYIQSWGAAVATQTYFGGGVTKVLDDAVVQIDPYVCTYTLDTSYLMAIEKAGMYRATLEAYRWQGRSTVVFNLFRGKKQGVVASLDEMIGVWDLVDDEPRTVSVTTYLRPGDLLAPCVAELDANGGNVFEYVNENVLLQDSDFPGEGVAFKSIEIEGPLYEMWPPASTRAVLVGVEFTDEGEIELSRSPQDHLREIVETFAERAFRRPVERFEVDELAALGESILDDGRTFVDAVRISIVAILSSPEFLYQPQVYQPGQLDDFEYATRLASFLWRATPDDELMDLAAQGRISDSSVVEEQVERMLDDARSLRFVEDFANQAYRLKDLKATTPAPVFRFDDQLGAAMALETREFIAELIREDLSASNLIASDFTFVNRPLAKLYEIPGISGQQMRRVDLPSDSIRGGLLGQGSILKITANGTTTSPVTRGNFVLALLGSSTPPPPAGVEGLEPDTRGTVTIREQLEAHRSDPVCKACHNLIDPPGFALEEFDPIGRFRTRYVGTGLPVDATGVTPSGQNFDGIYDYRQILVDENLDEVGRNLITQLLVFGRGARIDNSDRNEVTRILDATRGSGFGFRSVIHAVADSQLFRRR